MDSVVSTDGTRIAFDRHAGGDAGTVILVGGAFSYRAFPKMAELAAALVEHEIDDIAALIVAAAGGSASLFGWSSGAALALRAAASGRVAGLQRVVAFEPPFVVDRTHRVIPADLDETLLELVAADRRSETVRFYMIKAMGIPGVFVAPMRMMPVWSKLKATANSTPHDWAVMAEFMRGEPLRRSDWAGVTVPTLVLAGAKSDPLLRTAARAIADVLPNAEHHELPKLSHNPNVRLLAPAAAEFLTAGNTAARHR